MTKESFQKITGSYVYLDGATGSNLVRAGMPGGVCPDKWILEHPQVMLELQKGYVAAGTDILYAPTFTANRVKLREYGLEGQLRPMIKGLVDISRQAAQGADHPVYLAGDMTMTGEPLCPLGPMSMEELTDIYREQAEALAEAGVDLLVVETMMSLAEARAALIAAKEVCDLPVMVTMTFESRGRTLYGTDARTAAVVLESLGAAAVGVNCSTGPNGLKEIIEEMAACTRIPIIAKPNAGLPFLDEKGCTCYDMDPEDFAEEMAVLAAFGATVLGGCCGTTPQHIERLRQRIGKGPLPEVPRREAGVRYLASERQTFQFGLEGGFFIVGERINPTGKKLLQAQLKEGCMDKVLQFAKEQEACGARVLDVNMGMGGIDEKAMMLRTLEEVGGVTNLPLSLDSSHVDVLEAALRQYPGRALVNSVSLEKEKFEKLLPLVKKYGAMFILLPLSDRGLPENLEEKQQIIETILERAYALGLEKEDVVVDALVTTVGANGRAALEALETIRFCREKGLATICGLSNISFGLPERSFVNGAFLTLAVREGLTMAIANPSQELLAGCALAADMLLAKEGADLRYIEYAGTLAEIRERKQGETGDRNGAAAVGNNAGKRGSAEGVVGEAAGRTGSGGDRTGTDQVSSGEGLGGSGAEAASGTGGEERPCRVALRSMVLQGGRNGIAARTREALDEGEDPSALLNEVLLPAINEVGELFDKGKYFLPQLIASAEAMKRSIEVLEPLLRREAEGADMPVVVIATVEGDIHDIGKNLVALMLKNYGFRVIDLGKDVPAEEIVRTARENHARIIALSALMTTTMRRMKEVIDLARREKVGARIMVGGAVITREYADEIGADGYSADAAEAVHLAKRLVQEGENITPAES